MNQQYTILYWLDKIGPFFLEDEDSNYTGSIAIFDSLDAADEAANELEKIHTEYNCRVISIDSVHE